MEFVNRGFCMKKMTEQHLINAFGGKARHIEVFTFCKSGGKRKI